VPVKAVVFTLLFLKAGERPVKIILMSPSIYIEKREQLPDHQGVMRYYQPAFAPGRQDALDATSFILACYQQGRILPQEKCSSLHSD